jgi:hypothetical protein
VYRFFSVIIFSGLFMEEVMHLLTKSPTLESLGFMFIKDSRTQTLFLIKLSLGYFFFGTGRFCFFLLVLPNLNCSTLTFSSEDSEGGFAFLFIGNYVADNLFLL